MVNNICPAHEEVGMKTYNCCMPPVKEQIGELVVDPHLFEPGRVDVKE